MKKLNWKQWVAIALIVLVVIAAVVLHLVQPEISFAFAELMNVIYFVVGGVAGWLLNDHVEFTGQINE